MLQITSVIGILILTIVSNAQSISDQQSTTIPTSLLQAQSSAKIAQFQKNQIMRLRQTMSNGDISQISIMMNGYLNNNIIPCKSKIQYINSVSQILKQKININSYQIRKLQFQTGQNQAQRADLASQRTEIQKIKNDLLRINYDFQINLRETESKIIANNISKLMQTSNSYLSDLKNLPRNNINVDRRSDETAISKLIVEMANIDKMIGQTINQRQRIHQSMTDIKIRLLNDQITSRKSNITKANLQAEFRKYSELALQANMKIKQKEDQLKKLNTQLEKKQKTQLDYDIQKARNQLQLSKKTTGQTQAKINKINEVLRTNGKLIDSKLDVLNKQCLVGKQWGF